MDPDDIYLWPDGTWCFGNEVATFGHKSDDYEVIKLGDDRYQTLIDEDF